MTDTLKDKPTEKSFDKKLFTQLYVAALTGASSNNASETHIISKVRTLASKAYTDLQNELTKADR